MAPHDPFPSMRYDLAEVGELLADPGRAGMLLSLMGGESRPASELATVAGVTRQAASAHLRKLLEGGLLSVSQRGRHRYYALANPRLADLLESLAIFRDRGAKPRPALDPRREALHAARTCYSHLAGRLGVRIAQALVERELVEVGEGAYHLTTNGRDRLEALGLTRALPKRSGWEVGRACLDWTERTEHLGGALGGALAAWMFTSRWIARSSEGRAVRVTTLGRAGLRRELGIDW